MSRRQRYSIRRRRYTTTSLALAAPLALAFVSPLRAQQPIRFGACESPAVPGHEQTALHSVYVPMPDGVRVAVDVMLPKSL